MPSKWGEGGGGLSQSLNPEQLRDAGVYLTFDLTMEEEQETRELCNDHNVNRLCVAHSYFCMTSNVILTSALGSCTDPQKGLLKKK